MPDADLPALAQPRYRLDAVALTLLGAGVGVCLAMGGVEWADGPLGAAAAAVAGGVVEAVGVAAAVFAAGWFVLVGLYVAGRGPGRLLVRATGWMVLVGAGATLADFALASRGVQPPGLPSAYGPGGAVGAAGRFALDDALPESAGGAVAAGAGFLGLVLAAPGLVRAAGRAVWALVRWVGRWLARGNRWVASGGDRVIAAGMAAGRRLAARRVRPPAPPVVPLEVAPVAPPRFPTVRTPVPIETEPEPVEASSGTEPISIPADSEPDPIPITRAPDLSDTPPPKALPPASAPPADVPVYDLPSLDLLNDPDPFPAADHEQKLRDRATVLEKSFLDFGLNIKVVGIHTGPVITQYEVALETGLRLNKVTNLSDDLALTLGVSSVRIVAPLPGRTTVGIEVPNDHRQTVRLKELILATTSKAAKLKLPIFLGKDVEGRPLVYDMATMPHLLIAGRTGTGKSVCLNTVLQSFLLTRRPDECRLILIDPKQVEFNDYGKIPHLMHPVVTKNEKAEAILAWAVDKMEERYDLLRRARVRNIATYNELGWDEIIRRVDPQNEDERKALPRKMPYVIIVIDEVGDLLMAMKKEVESHIIRLAQKSRAAGIHLILATQRPTVDVITGLIKSNLPARICFQVASRADSAVVLDEKGAEKLLGMGDMLFLQPGTSTIIRGQGAYVDDKEIERVTASLSEYEPAFESELLNLKSKSPAGDGDGGSVGEKLRERDPLYEQAVEIVIREQRGSTSLLQRALGIGYGKASRFVDFMAEDGIVGAYNGSNARDVLLSPEEWELRKSHA